MISRPVLRIYNPIRFRKLGDCHLKNLHLQPAAAFEAFRDAYLPTASAPRIITLFRCGALPSATGSGDDCLTLRHRKPGRGGRKIFAKGRGEPSL